MKRRASFAALVATAALFAQPAATSPEGRTRQVLDLFFARNYAAIYEMFSPLMKKALTLDAYKAQAAQIAALGTAQSIGEPQRRTVEENTVVTLRVHWAAAELDFGVSWTAGGQIAGTWWAPARAEWQRPDYSRPDSFVEREVTVGSDEWKLPGTSSVPKGKGPFPAIVLVHGSGPNDRDETVAGAKVFRDLAEGLAARGVAVLRYDKRTKVYPAQCAADPNFTMNQETVEDAVRAAALLRTEPEIDPARVLVLGHSQGGYMAPRIARRDPKLAGVIVLAGNVRPLEDLILEQSLYIASLGGDTTPDVQKQLDQIKSEVARIKKLEPGQANLAPIFQMPVHYLLDLKGYNPAAEAAKLATPFLILQGERDYQVTMTDLSLWKAALGARKDVTFRTYPKLNHLFIAGEGKSTPAEYQAPGHVALEVIEDLTKWISRARL